MRAPMVSLRLGPSDDGLVLRASGELDLAGRDEIRPWIMDAVCVASRVVLDLTELTFCSASGLAMLVECDAKARSVASELVLVPGRRLAQLLAIIDLGHLVCTDAPAPASSLPPSARPVNCRRARPARTTLPTSTSRVAASRVCSRRPRRGSSQG
jgi:anti-anti-sigma factor